MKKIFSHLVIGSMLCGMLTGCAKNYLNKTPNDSLPPDEALKDVGGMQAALNGAYSGLRATDCYGRSIPILGDLMADNEFVETGNAGRYLSNFNYSITVNDAVALGIWQNLYAVIMRSNQVIDAKPTGPDADAVRAQAYGLRALSYFKLVNLYAKQYTDDKTSPGVPIVLHYDLDNEPKRSSVDSVYKQIVSDLMTAYPIAPDYSSSVTLSKYAIEGLLARTYLYMGDNVNAEKTAVAIIDSNQFSLVTPDQLVPFWSNPGIHNDGVEVMFEVDADVHNNNGSDDISIMFIKGGYKDIYASSDLYNLYSPTDARQGLMVLGTTKQSGDDAYMIYKYSNGNNPADKDNLKVLRLAEIYLIAAEAALPTDEATARQYLNALMAQRDPSFPGYTSTGAQLLDDIVTERRKELAFEGDRLTDLNRLQRTITRVQDPGSIAGPLSIPYSEGGRIQPIPQSEIQANPNLAAEQNPGYQ